MAAYVSCPTCSYFQLRAQRCCECHAVLDYRQADRSLATTSDIPTLTALLDYLESIPADSL